MTLLQIFLLLDIFLMGILTTLAVQHGRAHMAQKKPALKKPRVSDDPAHLSGEVRERMLRESELHFGAALNRTTNELQHDLTSTAEELNKLLEKLGGEIVGNEMERYKLQLEQLRTQNVEAINGAQSEIAKHQADLKAKMAEQQTAMQAKLNEELAAEKQRLLNQMDTKLADAVASFLLETLQHNVDLGAQTAYLTTMLDAHKDELVKGVKDEA